MQSTQVPLNPWAASMGSSLSQFERAAHQSRDRIMSFPIGKINWDLSVRSLLIALHAPHGLATKVVAARGRHEVARTAHGRQEY